jgi:hypothetical protein
MDLLEDSQPQDVEDISEVDSLELEVEHQVRLEL